MSMRTASISLICALALGLAAPGSGQGKEVPAGSGRALAALLKPLDQNRQLARLYRQCPGGLFKPEPSRSPRLHRQAARLNDACEGQESACFRACVQEGNGAACLDLAYIAQRKRALVAPRYAQVLFTLACANGVGAGCTNRAAGIRNGGYADDPIGTGPDGASERCQHRSFKIACEQRDPWGCAMLGQSYRLGEGTAENPIAARSAYQQSCKLSPDFEACSFSREGLKAIDDARS